MKPVGHVGFSGTLLLAISPLMIACPWCGGQTMVKADKLEWKDVASLPPGAKISVIEGPMDKPGPFTARLKVPAGYKIPPHWHPAIEHVTVISGAFAMGKGEVFDATKADPLAPGDVAIMQAKVVHFALAREDSVLQLHGTGPWAITYVNPADDPRNKVAPVATKTK